MRKLARFLLYLIFSIIAFAFVAPVLLLFIISFKPDSEVLNPATILPQHWTLINYHNVLSWSEEAPVARWFMNSVFVSCSITFLVLTLSSMAAFSIARLNTKGSQTYLTLIVVAMMIPAQLFLVPNYFILEKLHLLDTPFALIIPATAGGWGVFLLTQFMKSVPKEVEEASLIDGCSTFGVYWHVNLPLCAPALATLAVFTFIGSWNDYISPLVYLDSIRSYTLPVGLALYQSSYLIEFGRTFALGVIATVPLLFIFFIFQKQIVASMAAAGLKDS